MCWSWKDELPGMELAWPGRLLRRQPSVGLRALGATSGHVV
jgi:hypothetical protein